MQTDFRAISARKSVAAQAAVPLHRETAGNHRAGQVCATRRAARQHPAIMIAPLGRAADLPPPDQRGQRRLAGPAIPRRTAPPWSAMPRQFRRIDGEQPDQPNSPATAQSVAIDRRGRGAEKQTGSGKKQAHERSFHFTDQR